MAFAPRAGSADTGATLIASNAAASAKTILNVIAATGQTIKATEWAIEFDGTTSSDKPCFVEFCQSTQATAGTSSAVTPVLESGKGTLQSTAAKNYTSGNEPTVLTNVFGKLVDPNKGSYTYQFVPGREAESGVAGGLCIRVTVPAGGSAVNMHAYIKFEE